MKASLKSNLIGGLVVIAPLAVTLWVVLWIFEQIIQLPGTQRLRVTQYGIVNDVIQVTATVALVVVLLVVVGFVVRTATGVLLKNQLDRAARRVPLVRFVYNATQMAVEALSMGAEEFDRPVKIDLHGLRFTAFKTGGRTDGGRDIIFLPTAPNITSGFVIEVDPDITEETDETTEEALTRILSAGFASARDEDEVAEVLGDMGFDDARGGEEEGGDDGDEEDDDGADARGGGGGT